MLNVDHRRNIIDAVSLQPGHKLAHYEILEPIGKGGMGEVYRAKDSKLGRDVAIKVLPDEFAQDEERLRRFQREAKVLASLNHPGIAAIHGLEESEGTHYLVLELVPGETLAERISRGPIPIEEALDIAKKIAEAVEEAHEQGIIHRDLKPANIKQTEDGKIKILDFGLAKVFQAETPDADSSMSPTLTRDATRVGVILGTAAYMSPEQAKGKKVDKRADVWAFGVLLYEMLSGKRAFAGEDVSDTLAYVLTKEPDWDALPAETPAAILQVLRVCLAKDAKRRVRDIADVRLAMEGAFEIVGSAPAESSLTTSRWRIQRWFAALVVTVLVTGLAVWRFGPHSAEPVIRFGIVLPEGDRFSFIGRRVVAFSPDGTHVAYVTNGQIYLRAMDQMEATALRGTEGSRTPTFSPDGRWIVFQADGALKKVSISGGTPVTLCEAGPTYGVSWSSDDTIVFGQRPGGILRVSANGGEPEGIVEIDSNERAYGPQILPGGSHLLFTLAQLANWDEAEVLVQSLDTGERRVLFQGGADARYVPTGHLVYAVGGTLMAVPFDPKALELGPVGAVPVLESVARSASGNTGAAHFSFSESGALVFIPVDVNAFQSLVGVERTGKATPLTERRVGFRRPRLSPDGRRLAVTAVEGGASDIWILELERDTLSRLTTEGRNELPLWSPDGEWVVFRSERGNGAGLYRKRTDFTGMAERILERGENQWPNAWSRDGKWIVYDARGGGEGDLWVLPLDGEGEPRPFLETPFDEYSATLSPDGRFIAYQSDESGRDEIYVPVPRRWSQGADLDRGRRVSGLVRERARDLLHECWRAQNDGRRGRNRVSV